MIPPPSQKTGSRAFSLIEVTIAMAIAAVALSTLMALLPQGMNTMREAGDEAIMARIHQQVLNELQMADFNALNKYQGMEIYFDSQGEELGDSQNGSSGKGSFEHIYSARISVPDSSGGQMPNSVGGSKFSGYRFGKNAPALTLLRPVVIEVAAVSGLGANFNWSDSKYRSMIHTYQTMVVKMGQSFQP